MEPINQKERSAIFIQFLLIYSISLIVVGLLVYFNTRVVKKDYQVMKDKLAELESSTEFVGELMITLESAIKQIDKLEESPNKSTFEIQRDNIRDQTLNKLNITEPKSRVDSLNKTMYYICNSLINAKYRNLEIKDLEALIEKKERTVAKFREHMMSQHSVNKEDLDVYIEN